MKKWKQALALVLALVMALSLVALPSFAADEDASGSGTAASDGPAWPNEGAINLSKTAQPVDGKDGLYEITLTIQGKNYSTTSDVCGPGHRLLRQYGGHQAHQHPQGRQGLR